MVKASLTRKYRQPGDTSSWFSKDGSVRVIPVFQNTRYGRPTSRIVHYRLEQEKDGRTVFRSAATLDRAREIVATLTSA